MGNCNEKNYCRPRAVFLYLVAHVGRLFPPEWCTTYSESHWQFILREQLKLSLRVSAVTNKSYMLIPVTWKHVSLILVLVSDQDITEYTGPQSRLTELNAEVKKSFHNLRLRIQVRNTNFEYVCMHNRTQLWAVHQPLALVYMIIDGSEILCCVVSLAGFWADGDGAGQRVRQAGFDQSGGGTPKTDAEVQ